jgi:hypothetical protein
MDKRGYVYLVLLVAFGWLNSLLGSPRSPAAKPDSVLNVGMTFAEAKTTLQRWGARDISSCMGRYILRMKLHGSHTYTLSNL